MACVRRSASLNKSSGMVSRHIPANNFTRAAVQPHGQVEPAPALAGQIRNVAHPYLIGAGRGRLAEQAVGCSPYGRVGTGRTGHK